MDVREKLVELLLGWGGMSNCAEDMADYLIDSGVTVLLCKVGDKIFYIDRFTHNVEQETVKFLTITKNGVKPILTHHNIRFWDFYELGRNAFFTREQAVVAMEGVKYETADR